MTLPALAVEGLVHRFAGPPPVAVLDGVSFRVPAGGFASLVGPSGCGKSTVLRVLAGLLAPDAGRAEVHGESTIGRPGLVAYMPQRDLLLPWRRALDNATLGAEVGGLDRAAARARARELFVRFGLGGFERAWPSQLSGGMRQRLALLRTFLAARPVMLLDEPFGALDAITRREMHGWLEELWLADAAAGAARRTTLFVTHDVEEALLLSDEVHVVSSRPGRIADSVVSPFPRPRPRELVTSAEFVERKARLLAALDKASGPPPPSAGR
ncbi:MAG: ABC transporter ATP-binding protein [Acidimicrobiales bacterium]